MADSLLLDASLLLHSRTSREVRTALEEEFIPSPGEVMVPETVYRVASGDLEYYEPLLSVYGGQLRGGISSPEDFAWLRDSDIYPFTVFPEAPNHVGDVDDAFNVFMEVTEGDLILSRLLVEEWVFLTSNSWIAARTHRTFQFFKRAGAVAIELPRESFEALVRRTIRVPATPVPRPLKQSERLRAVTKWAAAGGPPFAYALEPLLGAFAGSIAGFFLLFDP